jgi:hypothetical protein
MGQLDHLLAHYRFILRPVPLDHELHFGRLVPRIHGAAGDGLLEEALLLPCHRYIVFLFVADSRL